jgi:hypothetical protein
VAKPVSDSSSGAPEETDTADAAQSQRVSENWFLTGDTNDPDSIETVAQIGWFQVLKGYVPEEWTLRQESFFRRRRQEKVFHR